MRILAILSLVSVLGCGSPVTDPSLEGFDHDPRPVAGAWITEFRDGSGQSRGFDAELLPAGGVFLGFFEFFRAGRHWRVQFAEGEWDGVRVRFTTRETIDAGPARDVQWIATYFPATETRPSRLLLTSTLSAVPIEYVRP